MKIILASASARRKELLTLIGLDYISIPSNTDETPPPNCEAHELVQHLALQKAQAVATQYPNDCVIGADTIVLLPDGTIIGKPKDSSDAIRILHLLQGKTHTVLTGVALLTPGHCDVRFDSTQVTFSSLTANEISWYVATGDPLDKAGAYGIQGPFGMFVKRIEGNYFNVIGLPLPTLYAMLKQAGIAPTQKEKFDESINRG